MYCIKCGVGLSDTEKKCPLCGTEVYHPNIKREYAEPHYPENKRPPKTAKPNAVNGAVLILFFIPLALTFLADLQSNGTLTWFGYVAGALLLAYTLIALPHWFSKPNPVIFAPCDFAATALYLLYINMETGGHWFLTFAFPLTSCIGVIVCTVVTLIRYIKKGRLYIFGGASMALGGTMILMEGLIDLTFGKTFSGWSFYPFAVLFILGGALIFLAINSSAREAMERKLFF